MSLIFPSAIEGVSSSLYGTFGSNWLVTVIKSVSTQYLCTLATYHPAFHPDVPVSSIVHIILSLEWVDVTALHHLILWDWKVHEAWSLPFRQLLDIAVVDSLYSKNVLKSVWRSSFVLTWWGLDTKWGFFFEESVFSTFVQMRSDAQAPAP